jgi:hypothetical protein
VFSSLERCPRHVRRRGAVEYLGGGRLGELRDELKGVREAEHALNAGEPGRALAALEELQRFRGGSLREERAALRVLANCLLATSTSGDEARRFLSTYSKSFYAPRIRAACGE